MTTTAQQVPSGQADGEEPVPSDVVHLKSLLAERAELCERYAARQVAFAELVETQSTELKALHDALGETQASLEARYEETARLSKMLIGLEEVVEQRAAEIVKTRDDAAERETRRIAELEEVRLLLGEITRERDDLLARDVERVLAEHELAVRTSEIGEVKELLARERDLTRQLRSLLHGVVSSRAWRFGRVLLRHPDLEIPGDSTIQPQSLDYQRMVLSKSDMFDARWYRTNYLDEAEGDVDPAEHYLKRGTFIGLDPGPNFSTVAYLRAYRDVRKSGMNPLVHYIEHGRVEGRGAGCAAEARDSFAPAPRAP